MLTRSDGADALLANHTVLAKLLDRAKDRGLQGAAHAEQVNNAFYYFHSQSVSANRVRRNTLSTEARGEGYIDECLANGVPIPESVLSEEWTNHGDLSTEFINEDEQAELWSWESTNPNGICVALPRWVDDRSRLFGIICFGRDTGKVCYFDNPRGATETPLFIPVKGEVISMSQLIGGAELISNNGGVCTDCHAGENPFIIHPRDPAFDDMIKKSGPLFSSVWPDPIVDQSWVQNPGPFTALPPSTTGASCETCHMVGTDYRARFPLISQALPGYCSFVLEMAIQQTMPLDGDPALYASHASFLMSLCDDAPVYGPGNGTGTDVTNSYGDDDDFLSPPIVGSPIYACTSVIGVRGARLDSTVTVLINDNPVAQKVIRATSGYVDIVVPPLVDQDEVTAFQSWQGTDSDVSNLVKVYSHLADYPNGLPRPTTNPRTVYECAHRIAVEHAPGATLRVITDHGPPRINGGGSIGYTAVRGDGPFGIHTSLHVTQEICDDESVISGVVYTLPRPNSMTTVQVEPAAVYAGQQLVDFRSITHGAVLDVSEANSLGFLGGIDSWPITSYRDWDFSSVAGRPFAIGDRLDVEQTLCVKGPIASVLVTKNCGDVRAPRVAPAKEGQDYIIVTEFIPGATLRVYDQNGNELGDGAGALLLLSRRLLAGEAIVVIQELAEGCASGEGREIIVDDGDAAPIKERE